jgi:hypothetical protein
MFNDNNTLNDKSEGLLDFNRLLGFRQLIDVQETSKNPVRADDIAKVLNKIGEVPPPPPPP